MRDLGAEEELELQGEVKAEKNWGRLKKRPIQSSYPDIKKANEGESLATRLFLQR